MENYLQPDINTVASKHNLECADHIYRIRRKNHIRRWLWGLLILLFLSLFLPWTQNIQADGKVTTLRQEQRPQEVNTIIAGTIAKWYVKEGDIVKAGDTLLQLSEVKVDYFDPKLLERTAKQIEAKQLASKGYAQKAGTATSQEAALEQGRKLKLQSLENKISQQQLKVNSDEADVQASQNELTAYTRQLNAAKQMLDSGAISLSDFERRKISYQNAVAKNRSASNKLLQSQQELGNLRIEQLSTVQDYTDKMAKASGEKYSALSSAASTDAEISKLENQYASYDARRKLYFVTAPQGGQINRANKAGLGEFIKEGELIAEIVPDRIEYAVELFVNPMDLPLVNPGQRVRFVFDGYPAIVFSGWPKGSYGIFSGKVSIVEKSIHPNGKFRILVTEDPSDRQWPPQLSMGTGAKGIMLLRDVRIYYELWRNINGFPPLYYKPVEDPKKSKG